MAVEFHILPLNDDREHEESAECWCDPLASYIDEETGLPYPNNGLFIIHNAADHREFVEVALGEPMGPDKKWMSVRIER